MLSYRKLAMRVLNRPLHVKEGISPRPAAHRAAALALTAAMLTTLTAPAFAGTWYIEDGDITISAGEDGNDVTQNETTTRGDKDTVVKNRDKDTSSSNTVTINAEKEDDTVDVTLEDVNIDTSKTGEAAVSVTGKGDTTIELDGDNVLKSGSGHAGLEHNKTDDSGSLTIQDEDGNGSLDAAGGFKGAGIGSGGDNDAQVKITGGKITASCGDSWGAGIGSGSRGTGYVEITGGEINATGDYMGAGIGGGSGGDGNVTISGGSITASGGQGAAGIGGGYRGDGDVTITGDAVIKNAVSNEGYGAGIGGGIGSDGNVTISGNAKIENAEGGYGAAGIGGGAFASPDNTGNGTVRISDNATINNAQGGIYGAGIGGGVFGLGDVTIEGNATVNATGGAGGTGIGGGAGAENDDDGSGNQITIRSDETGSPTIKAVGGGVNEEEDITIGGAGIGSGCESGADTDITIEGKVTIVAVAGEGNAAIGANGVEQEFPNLDDGSSITRYDSEGNDTTLPSDPGHPLPDDSDGSEASVVPANPDSMLSGVVVTDASGRRISYTSIRGNRVLTVRAGRFSASLHTTLGALRALRAEGVETITFRTLMRSSSISLDTLLAMGGDDTEVVLTHRTRSSTLTVGGKAV